MASREGGTVPSAKRKASAVIASGVSKKPRTSRTSQAELTVVQRTDNDMLVIETSWSGSVLSGRRRVSAGAKKGAKSKNSGGKGKKLKTLAKRKHVKSTASKRAETSDNSSKFVLEGGKAGASGSTREPMGEEDVGWGTLLPEAVLIMIFQCVVDGDGPVPFLCRAARVCWLWRGAAESPVLWRRVQISRCCVEPQLMGRSSSKSQIKSTLSWLVSNRLSLMQEFQLSGWNDQEMVDYAVRVVSSECQQLSCVRLNRCAKPGNETLLLLGQSCAGLHSLDLKDTSVEISSAVAFLEAAGDRLQRLWLTASNNLNGIFTAISSNCPALRVLEVDTRMPMSPEMSAHKLPTLSFPFTRLQNGCPHLQVLRLMNMCITPSGRVQPDQDTGGFPELQELSLATMDRSSMADTTLWQLLHRSPRLRLLDLRGCPSITPKCLLQLPCYDLEELYLGLYLGTACEARLKRDVQLVLARWAHSLSALDVNSQPCREAELEEGLFSLAVPRAASRLETLNLAGTVATVAGVSAVLRHCPRLSSVNLTSCRNLPRGLKRLHRTPAELQELRERLLPGPAESGDTVP
ncbi:F-box/LRR-repeat protein 6 [Lethenteron reissneri]|uniref:F-box/LRR-repeat protein 6 n=1 Tax=Lethenteron reissneri TaxID=7753 RepID=UPI002AB66E28|nr:F-box/LRR-repeat protein 6 [Lethenteron reissneri]XP_061427986.1 F-box/LRR-repeat protein 6 [Lethenteron reissneri]XP_061427987.1 F-box/LRR-repeat protein 6 [Lethenteron reissneri]XP_061427988.1 F-box/LRR-repeat protein 6 [Lethenteron reissneri]